MQQRRRVHSGGREGHREIGNRRQHLNGCTIRRERQNGAGDSGSIGECRSRTDGPSAADNREVDGDSVQWILIGVGYDNLQWRQGRSHVAQCIIPAENGHLSRCFRHVRDDKNGLHKRPGNEL